MKLIFLFALLPLVVFGQDSTGNFYAKNNSAIWRKSFPAKLTFQELVKEIKKTGTLTNIDTFDNAIVGQSVESAFDYRGAGYTVLTVNSGFLLNNTFKSSVLIEHHDSSYTVTIQKILFINQLASNNGILSMSPGSITSFEDVALNKEGRFSSFYFKKTTMPKVMEYQFTKSYTF